MRRQLYPLFAAFMLIAMLLGACSAAATPTQTAPPADTAAPVINTVVVTQIVPGATQVITATPGPATATVPPKATALPAGSIQISAGGATFPLPLYTEWTYAYSYVDPAVVINYQGIGSGGGKKSIIDGTFDFAGSDSVLVDTEYAAGKDLQMYPTVAGAVVPIYNVAFKTTKTGAGTPTPAPLPGLILDRATLVGIYSGKIAMWNDPAIIALNAPLKDALPAAKIVVVHRSDSSGTTEIFTNALNSFDSANWKDHGPAIQWPTDKLGGVGGKGNPGVAAAVQNTPNSIGYVELDYALANSIAYAKMINKAGKTVDANGASLASAMNDYKDKFTDKLTNVIVDGPSDTSWPISAYTYFILHTTSMTDCVKAQKILQFIKWALTDANAAKLATKLGYSTLTPDVQTKVLAKLGEVTCKGAKVLQ